MKTGAGICCRPPSSFRDAVLLDGGVSGQLAVRDGAGDVHRWPGLRRVPLGLMALAASDSAR